MSYVLLNEGVWIQRIDAKDVVNKYWIDGFVLGAGLGEFLNDELGFQNVE